MTILYCCRCLVAWLLWWCWGLITICDAAYTTSTGSTSLLSDNNDDKISDGSMMDFDHDDDDEFPRVHHCSFLEAGDGGGGSVCPVGNTCCRISSSSNVSACIPSDLGTFNGTCCGSSSDATTTTRTRTTTGCGVGYKCVSVEEGGDYCVANPDIVKDPLVQVLPRYPLCKVGKYSNITQIHGLEIPFSLTTTINGSTSVQRQEQKKKKLLYYSSHGSLESLMASTATTKTKIRRILVVIHGANRNADDYFCSATAAANVFLLQQQQQQTKKTTKTPPKLLLSVEEVLIVAPRFVVPTDIPTSYHNNTTLLLWEDVPNGSWRYGANAIDTNISSFDAMDFLITTIAKNVVLGTTTTPPPPITVFGHSSGGQFVQRWALLSPILSRRRQQQQKRVRVVVVNPSSYVYLTPKRYINGHWILPPPNHHDCPRYNQWEWGLEIVNTTNTANNTTNNATATTTTPQYVQNVLHQYYDGDNSTNPQKQNPYHKLIHRFLYQRYDVIYLVGSLDRCNVSATTTTTTTTKNHHPTPWCESHGLETTCMDELQGTNRWERNERYMTMLNWVNVNNNNNQHRHQHQHRHRQVIVDGVGHDHSLIMSSPEGLKALFDFDHDHDHDEEDYYQEEGKKNDGDDQEPSLSLS